MASFLQGEYTPAISWLEQKESDADLVRPGHTRRRIVAPIAVALLIFFRTSGLSMILDFLEQTFAAKDIVSARGSTIIDFKDAQQAFGGSSITYAVGAVYAAIVAAARKLQVLL